MKRWLLAGLLAGAWSTCASAADLGPYRPLPPPEPYYEAARDVPWSWHGFYVGVNAGYGWAEDNTVTFSGPGVGNAFGALDPDGWYGGGQIGYNAQFASLVFGLEADLQASDISDSLSGPVPGSAFFATATTNIDWFSTLRARAGFAAGPALIYATGGFAFADVNSSLNASNGVTSVSLSNDEWKTGYTVGGGIEWAFAPNWSLKSEYLYVDLGDETLSGGGFTSTQDIDFHTVRLGLNYRF